MSAQDTARWQAIETLFDAALDQPVAQREDFVRRQAGEDEQLRTRVLELLQAEQAAGDFMESGPQTTEEEPQQAPSLHGQIGPWRIAGSLGRGGMGEVFRAERADGQYAQTVALKLLHTHDERQAARLESERQILANLNHPNIARLIDGGLAPDGRPYMAMEFIDGQDLGQHLRTRAPALNRRLDVFLKICDAVSYAHAHLVIHRDIKPENILIDEHGEPRLLDFGIAKLNEAGQQQNQTQALATPNYAAPEQMTGGLITARTDVYGLGATLYFMLCQQAPLDLEGASLPQLLDRLSHVDPLPPSQRSQSGGLPRLSSDLDAICAKAMHKDPGQRYSNVEQLAEDVSRYLQHEPVRARPPALSYRIWRYLQRNRLALASAAALTLSLVVGLAATSWQAHLAAQQRDQARREASRLATLQSAILKLFETAASEAGDQRMSARELFGQSAARIEADFSDDPATSTSLMQMLGQLLLATEDFATAKQLLLRAESNYTEVVDPAVLASIQIDLAHIAYRDGELDRARELHGAAQGIWQGDPSRFHTELIWGATLASQIARAEGRADEAVEILREAAALATEYWGHNHDETGIVTINLAVAHYYNNDLPAALDTCAQAWAIWQAIDQTQSPDALNLLGNWGLFALIHGDTVTSEKRLAEALELRTQLYGPSAAQATLMKNLGVVHRLNGRRNAGMRLLEQAEWMTREYAGTGGRLHTAAVYALSRALIEEDHPAEARELLEADLAASAGKSYRWRALNQALLASLISDPADIATAQGLFRDSLQQLAALGKTAISQYSDALYHQAHWLARRNRPQQALDSLQQALASKLQIRQEDHYDVLRMQAFQAQLMARADQQDAARSLLDAVLARTARKLGEQHALHRQFSQIQL